MKSKKIQSNCGSLVRFFRKLNHHRDIYWNQMPMKVQDIKQFTRKLDKNATINDVMVSAFTGALDRYARAVGKPNQKVRLLIAIPVNVCFCFFFELFRVKFIHLWSN
jgi:hypothetical protein